MKFTGGILIWLCVIYLSQTVNCYLKSRPDQLEKTVFLIDTFRYRMGSLLMPVNEVVYSVNNESLYEELLYIRACADYLEKGLDFPDAWEKSVCDSRVRLNKEEKIKLICFGKSIGKTDTESQNKTIELFREYFIRRWEVAKDKRIKYATPIMLSGILLGCALFILII